MTSFSIFHALFWKSHIFTDVRPYTGLLSKFLIFSVLFFFFYYYTCWNLFFNFIFKLPIPDRVPICCFIPDMPAMARKQKVGLPQGDRNSTTKATLLPPGILISRLPQNGTQRLRNRKQVSQPLG